MSASTHNALTSRARIYGHTTLVLYELKAGYYWYLAAWTIDARTAQSQAYASAMKALELDPTLVAARSFAQTAKPDWNWIDEIAALEEVARTEPNNINALNALTYDLMIGGYFNTADKKLLCIQKNIGGRTAHTFGQSHRSSAMQQAHWLLRALIHRHFCRNEVCSYCRKFNAQMRQHIDGEGINLLYGDVFRNHNLLFSTSLPIG